MANTYPCPFLFVLLCPGPCPSQILLLLCPSVVGNRC